MMHHPHAPRANLAQVFDLAGKFRRAFGRAGKAKGELGRPRNITAHKGRLYVAAGLNRQN